MIARTWRGWTRRESSDAYLAYVERTGRTAARGTPGNKGFDVLRRDDGDRTEFVTISLWKSLDSIRAFAGDGLEVVFYPEDDEYLVDRERFVTHYELTGPWRGSLVRVTGASPAAAYPVSCIAPLPPSVTAAMPGSSTTSGHSTARSAPGAGRLTPASKRPWDRSSPAP